MAEHLYQYNTPFAIAFALCEKPAFLFDEPATSVMSPHIIPSLGSSNKEPHDANTTRADPCMIGIIDL